MYFESRSHPIVPDKIARQNIKCAVEKNLKPSQMMNGPPRVQSRKSKTKIRDRLGYLLVEDGVALPLDWR